MGRPTVVRIALFLATVVATWGVLSIGISSAEAELMVGQPAPQTFTAEKSEDVVDSEETARREKAARDAVEPIREPDSEVESSVNDSVNAVFDDVEALVVDDALASPPTSIPELPATTTSTTGPPDASTTTTILAAPSTIVGVVFLDVDGDGEFKPDAEGDRVDQGLERVSVEITTEGDISTVTTGPGGVWSVEIITGAAVISVDDSDPEIPDGWVVDTDNLTQLILCESGEECPAENIGFAPGLRPLVDIETALAAQYPLPGPTISYLAATASDDVVRSGLGEPLHLRTVRQASLQRVLEEFGRRIEPDQLQEAKARQRTSPPLVFHVDTGQDVPGGEAAGEIVATFLQANYLINQERTAAKQDEAAADVPEVTVTYVEGQTIIAEGVLMAQIDIDAINATTTLATTEQASMAMLAVIAVLVALLGLYLARFRLEFWARPRMVALFGILILLAGAAVRGTVVIQEATSWYVLPAVAFGFVTGILFDQRIAVLMALSVGVLTAVGTLDVGITVYAVLAALAPIPFVSSVSTRGAFRNAVVLSSLVAAGIAASTSWFFHVGPNDVLLQVVGVSVAWAFGVSVVASLVGLAALQFFESAFDITTTLSLLDLTDRNHKALQLLQEEAFGTFNHSLMVGTLADAAAREIGANPLLARAMAYYHDLGKTENPTYFIENQFGIPNPHDELDPRESAKIIRSHVTAGVALARQFKIPTDVTQGIVSHHGDGVMRFFYERAREQNGEDVDVDDFRHIGHKPRTAETAILMVADSLEAACRAVFQTEEPTPDAIEKVVNRVMDEKLEDGQLSESPLTLGELTKIRAAFLESLVGHYHQRIAYPNFPGN
jgi:putative nucleotidyltransferase with HDIG domain